MKNLSGLFFTTYLPLHAEQNKLKALHNDVEYCRMTSMCPSSDKEFFI